MKPDENTHSPEKSTNPTPEAPKIFALKKQGGEWRMSRKSFLEAASAMVGGVALGASVSPGSLVPPVGGTTQGTDAVCAHEQAVRSLAISPDGKWLISGGQEGKVKLWALPNGALVKSADARSGVVSALACSPNGKILAIQTSGVSLWTLPDLVKAKIIEFPGGEISSTLSPPLAISPDGRLLASVGADTKVKLWMLPAGTLSNAGAEDSVRRQPGRISGALALAFTPDGTTLAVGNLECIELRSIPGLATRQRLLFTPAPRSGTATWTAFKSLAITPDGKLIVAARRNSSIELASLSSGEVVKTLRKKVDSIRGLTIALAISPDGRLLASGGHENHIDLWSLSDGKLQQRLLGHSGPVNALAISPDGTLLASGSDDRTIRLWSLPQGKQLLCLLDLEASYKTTKGVQYKSVNQYGQTITYTLPCGSPIPAGAVCVCNCVPGSLTAPANHTQRFSSTGVCTCNLVCTCNTVCTCQAVGSPGGYPGGYGGHYWYPN